MKDHRKTIPHATIVQKAESFSVPLNPEVCHEYNDIECRTKNYTITQISYNTAIWVRQFQNGFSFKNMTNLLQLSFIYIFN